jgi:hypothetical protein
MAQNAKVKNLLSFTSMSSVYLRVTMLPDEVLNMEGLFQILSISSVDCLFYLSDVFVPISLPSSIRQC